MFLWYVINTYSGHEKKVKTNLEHRIVSLNQSPRFRRVVVPTEQVIETKDGQKVQTEKRVLPGLRARQHGSERRGLDGRQGNARRHRVRRRRREAGAALPERGRPDPPHGGRRWRPCGEVAGAVRARRVGQGHLRAALRLRRRDRRRQPRRAEAQGARRHLRAPGAGRARLRPGQEDRLRRARRSLARGPGTR